VIGDVGKGWFAGENRKIIWNYRNEFKPDPNASDYYFEISAKKPGHAWVYILSGAIVAGTGAAVYFMTREKSEDPGPKFPIPVRP
jgi:hypothetical protein